MIILGYEKLQGDTHHGWNFNGRYEPSRISLTEEQLANVPSYHAHIYRNIVAPERYPASHRPILCDYIRLKGKSWERKQISDIPEGQVYFYPIEILGVTAYTEFTSHISINPRTLDDIRTGKAYLIFNYIHEGNLTLYHPWYDRFCDLIRDLQVPREQVYMFHGDYDTGKYANAPFMYVPATGIYSWLMHHRPQPLIEYDPEHLYVTYARNPSYHRILLLSLLKRRNLDIRGFYSLGPISEKQLNYYNQANLRNTLHDTDKEWLLKISNHSPDNRNFDREGCQTDINLLHHRTSFLSLVAETLPEIPFFSEKTFKPLAIGHPFISFGGKGQLHHLRSMGFLTFNDWWDETYDEIDDWMDRTQRIVEIIERLHLMSIQTLKNMRHDMHPVLVHNQNVFRDLCNNPYGPHRDIAETLLNIVNNR
jgi:hypothetical protein